MYVLCSVIVHIFPCFRPIFNFASVSHILCFRLLSFCIFIWSPLLSVCYFFLPIFRSVLVCFRNFLPLVFWFQLSSYCTWLCNVYFRLLLAFPFWFPSFSLCLGIFFPALWFCVFMRFAILCSMFLSVFSFVFISTFVLLPTFFMLFVILHDYLFRCQSYPACSVRSYKIYTLYQPVFQLCVFLHNVFPCFCLIYNMALV